MSADRVVDVDGVGGPHGVAPAEAPATVPGPVASFDHDRVAAAVREILIGIGEDPDRDGLRETPDRVACGRYTILDFGSRVLPLGEPRN